MTPRLNESDLKEALGTLGVIAVFGDAEIHKLYLSLAEIYGAWRSEQESMEAQPVAHALRNTGRNLMAASKIFAHIGCNPKTLSNHKANVKAALAWFAGAKNLPKHGAILMPAWASLRGQIPDEFRRDRLSGLIRFASAKSVEPINVNEEVLDDYMAYRSGTTALACDDAARRRIARAWNACVAEIVGWPQQRLVEPPVKSLTNLPWETFPEQLRQEIETYLEGFKKIRRGAKGERICPCKQSSIDTRRRELQAFARMAVKQGYPVGSLNSLADVLNPDLVEEVLEAYWEENGDEPRVWTIDMAWKLLAAAQETKCLPESDIEKLDELRAALDEHRDGGLTEKNLNVIRAVLTEGVWDKVVRLPRALMQEARRDRHTAPTKAAVNASIAVAIAILSIAPVRLGNLIKVKLDENLIKPGGADGPYWLVFPKEDVKNRVQLQHKLLDQVGEIIDEYIDDFRPVRAARIKRLMAVSR
jgi:hypothetical protein